MNIVFQLPSFPPAKASASESGKSRVQLQVWPAPWGFSGLNHSMDLKIGTLVATLPGIWCYRVSAGTGWHGVSIL